MLNPKIVKACNDGCIDYLTDVVKRIGMDVATKLYIRYGYYTRAGGVMIPTSFVTDDKSVDVEFVSNIVSSECE